MTDIVLHTRVPAPQCGPAGRVHTAHSVGVKVRQNQGSVSQGTKLPTLRKDSMNRGITTLTNLITTPTACTARYTALYTVDQSCGIANNYIWIHTNDPKHTKANRKMEIL